MASRRREANQVMADVNILIGKRRAPTGTWDLSGVVARSDGGCRGGNGVEGESF